MNYPAHLPIKSWALEDRPREKFLQRGKDALTDAELLAILIGSGTRELSAIDLARKVLEEMGGFHQLAKCSVKELTRIKGIGKVKALSIVAAFELSRRKSAINRTSVRLTSSQIIADLLIPRMEDLQQEVFHVLFINQNLKIVGEKQIFQGGVASTVIDVRLVIKEAVNYLASAIVLAHNHPSGSLQPSHADKAITQKVVEAARLFDIRVLDHLIISSMGYYSFADQGLMD